MSIHTSCDMYLRLGLLVQIGLYYVLPYKAKISAQHGISFILDRCIVYIGLTMPNLQKKRQLTFKIFNIKNCTLSLGTEYITKLTLALHGLEVKCRTRDLDVLGSNLNGSTVLCWSLGKTLQGPRLEVVRPRRAINDVNCLRDKT